VRGGDHPTVGRVNLIKFLQPALPQNSIEKFVRKSSLLLLRGAYPLVQHDVLDPSHRFLFRNAGVGHAIQMTPQEFFLLLRS